MIFHDQGQRDWTEGFQNLQSRRAFHESETATELRANGETAVGLGIIRQSKANTVSVSDNVRAEIERIRRLIESF